MIAPEQIAVNSLREWLVFTLPTQAAAVNSSRPAKLISASAGPFTLNGDLTLSTEGLEDASPTIATFAAGTYTAQQVADAITAQSPDFAASVDSWGRLALVADPPIGSLPSVMCAFAGSNNAAFGWGLNGEVVTREALVAPSWRGVMDGVPLPAQDLGPGFWVIISDRSAKVVAMGQGSGGDRRAMYDVSVHLDVMRSLGMNQSPLRDREAISAVVRCVREALTDTTAGRQLGRAAVGDVYFTAVPDAAILGQALQAPANFNANRGGFYYDVAAMEVIVRINAPATGP